MRRNKQFLAALLSILTFVTFGQTTKNNCRDLNFIINKTVESIQKNDDSLYMTLIDHDAMMTMLLELSVKDSTFKQLYERMKAKPQLVILMFQSGFSKLTATIERELKTKKWNIKLKEYYIENKQEYSLATHLTIVLKLKANGEKRSVMMYATKYKDCYYIFEPLMQYFTKGW